MRRAMGEFLRFIENYLHLFRIVLNYLHTHNSNYSVFLSFKPVFAYI